MTVRSCGYCAKSALIGFGWLAVVIIFVIWIGVSLEALREKVEFPAKAHHANSARVIRVLYPSQYDRSPWRWRPCGFQSRRILEM
jgi:hypothetical protein